MVRGFTPATAPNRGRSQPVFRRAIPRHVWPPLGDVLPILGDLGIAPEDVDDITYDHLHTQDVRKWLGTPDRPPAFPNAKLLVTRQEWASAQGPLPLDAQWYCPDGVRGVSEDRVVFLDHDVVLVERGRGHVIRAADLVPHSAMVLGPLFRRRGRANQRKRGPA
jgi:hypothetical protein